MAEPLLVAGPGWVVGGMNVTADTGYAILGPIPEGRILDRLEVFYSVSGLTLLGFSAAMTGSHEASQENFEAGSHLIQRGGAAIHGRPAVALRHGAAGQFRFLLPIGVRVQAGARYVVCAMSSSGGEVSTIWNMALFPRFVLRAGGREVPA